MQPRRIHPVNSVSVAIPFALLPSGTIGTVLWFAFAICPTVLIAQEESQFPSQSKPTFANPFRLELNSSAAVDRESTPRELRTTPSNTLVDVIRLTKLAPHMEPPVITAMSVSREGDLIAAAGDDHAIRIVDLVTGKTTATLLGHLDWVRSVEFSPNGLLLASCGNDGTLRVWSLGSSPRVMLEQSVDHALMTLTFLSDECIYVAGFSNRIYRYNFGSKDFSIVHVCECRDIRSIATSPDRQWIAYGGRDGVLRMRRADSTRPLNDGHEDPANELNVPLHFDRIRSVQFSSDGLQITSVGEDRRIVHYDIASRVVIGQTEIGGGKLYGLCQLEPHLFAIAGSDNTIRIFSDTDQQVHAKLVGHDGSVSILKRTKNHIISGSFDTTIRIWDIQRSIATIDTQGRYVHPVAAQFEDSGAGEEVK